MREYAWMWIFAASLLSAGCAADSSGADSAKIDNDGRGDERDGDTESDSETASDGDGSCVPDTARECPCGESVGVQVCREDSEWGVCVCGADGDADADGDGDTDTETDTDGDGDSETAPDTWVTRATTPESAFRPDDIEAVIDDIVDRLNETGQKPGLTLAFLPKSLTGFFESAVNGADRAFAELGVVGVLSAPDAGDDSTVAAQLQSEAVEEQVEVGVAGLGLAPFSSALVPSVDAAVDAGVTVITFDSDLPDSKRQLFLFTDNTAAGRTGAATLAGLLGGSLGTVVVLGNEDEAWTDGYTRTQAAITTLEAEGYTVATVPIDWIDSQANVDDIQRLIETADPPAVGCLGLFSNGYLCADAAAAAGVEADIAIAVFDVEPETLEYMSRGIIQATHVQRSYYMGYLLPYLLYAVENLGLEETRSLVSPLMVDDARVDLGLDVITDDNTDEYYTFFDELYVLI